MQLVQNMMFFVGNGVPRDGEIVYNVSKLES